MENSTQAVTVTAKKYGKKIGIAVLTVIMVLWLASLIFSGAYADEHPELELLLQESARIIPELKQAKEEALKWNNRLETLQQEFFDNSEKLKQYTEADTGNNEFFHTNEGEKKGESVMETPLFPESGNLNKEKLQAVFDKYSSPLNAEEYIKACSQYPAEMCKIYVGVMTHESRLCTKFYKPEVEKAYHNCGGWKSAEMLKTKKADKNGSWLREFASYDEFYRIVLGSFYLNYWEQGLRTPETISKKYVGKYSQNWVNTVHNIKKALD